MKIAVSTLVSFVFFLTPFVVDAQVMNLTTNLKEGDSGEEVSLLQEWLGVSATGTFGPATKEAVINYQIKIGYISAHTAPGVVGPFTRAALNATYGQSQGGVEWLESNYDEVKQWNGESFVQLPKRSFETEQSINKVLSVWFLSVDDPIRNGRIYGSEGYNIGFQNGKLVATYGDREAVATNIAVTSSVWHHVHVLFFNNYVTFVFGNQETETVPLKRSAIKWSLFDSFFNIFSMVGGNNAQPESERTSIKKQVNDSPSFLGKIRTFFARIFGGDTRVAQTDTTSQPTTQKPTTTPAEKEPVEQEPKKPVATVTKPTKPTPVAPITPLIPTTTPDTATTTAIAPTATSTATTTASTATSTVVIATSTPDTATSTTSTSPSTVVTSGGGGGGGGTTTPPPAEEKEPEEPIDKFPAITMLGNEYVEITAGTTYTDPGATASDPEDGDLTQDIIVAGDTVDIFNTGTYIITYDVEDSYGNPAPPQYRTIVVQAPDPIDPEEQEPSYTLAPEGQTASLKVSSSGSSGPSFTNATIAPLHVYVGQTQTLTVQVSSSEEIESVTATSKLDHQTITLELEETSPGSVN